MRTKCTEVLNVTLPLSPSPAGRALHAALEPKGARWVLQNTTWKPVTVTEGLSSDSTMKPPPAVRQGQKQAQKGLWESACPTGMWPETECLYQSVLLWGSLSQLCPGGAALFGAVWV